MQNTNSQIKFKTEMLKSNLCDYIDAYRLAKETINMETTVNSHNREKKHYLNGVLHFDCISEVNSAQVDNTKDIDVGIDNTKDIDVGMPTYNLIEYRYKAIVYGNIVGMRQLQIKLILLNLMLLIMLIPLILK